MMGNGDKKILKSFDPIIEIIDPGPLELQKEEVHFNIAVGPKVGVNIGLPMKEKWLKQLAFGAGIRLDLLRFDNRLAIYNGKLFAVWMSCRR